MDDILKLSVEHIHQSSTKVVLHVAGGASHSLAWLLSVPGASNTILEAGVPYHRSAFLDVIGTEAAASLTSFASIAAARRLAEAAYRRGVHLAEPGTRVCGVAAACGLATLSKQGDHRAYVATYSCDRITEYELLFKKNYRNRWNEDLISSRLVLQAMLDDIGGLNGEMSKEASYSRNKNGLDTLLLSRHSPMFLLRDLLVKGESLSGPTVSEMPDCVQAVLEGDTQFAEFTNGTWNRGATSASLIFPGSFNPVHIGHRKLMDTAKSMYPDHIAAFEISVTNPDKPPLGMSVVRDRLSQLSEQDIVLITRAPLFATKATLFPNTVFVVGVDTAIRIVTPRYYGGQRGLMSALIDLKARGCKFAVAGRLEQHKDGTQSEMFQNLSNVAIPAGFEDMFEEIPFRVDISSSQMRASNGYKKGS